MHHIQVTEATVLPGMMQEFVHAVQRWERLAFDDPDAPEYHAVYVSELDPHQIFLVTQFRDRATASRFSAAGMPAAFNGAVHHLLTAPAALRPFDLFYGAGSGGTNAIFGEDSPRTH